jgi:cell shape-determining protein MreC
VVGGVLRDGEKLSNLRLENEKLKSDLALSLEELGQYRQKYQKLETEFQVLNEEARVSTSSTDIKQALGHLLKRHDSKEPGYVRNSAHRLVTELRQLHSSL